MSETNRHCLNFGDEPGFTVKDCENTGTEPKCDLCAARDLTALREELAVANERVRQVQADYQYFVEKGESREQEQAREENVVLAEMVWDAAEFWWERARQFSHEMNTVSALEAMRIHAILSKLYDKVRGTALATHPGPESREQAASENSDAFPSARQKKLTHEVRMLLRVGIERGEAAQLVSRLWCLEARAALRDADCGPLPPEPAPSGSIPPAVADPKGDDERSNPCGCFEEPCQCACHTPPRCSARTGIIGRCSLPQYHSGDHVRFTFPGKLVSWPDRAAAPVAREQAARCESVCRKCGARDGELPETCPGAEPKAPEPVVPPKTCGKCGHVYHYDFRCGKHSGQGLGDGCDCDNATPPAPVPPLCGSSRPSQPSQVCDDKAGHIGGHSSQKHETWWPSDGSASAKPEAAEGAPEKTFKCKTCGKIAPNEPDSCYDCWWRNDIESRISALFHQTVEEIVAVRALIRERAAWSVPPGDDDTVRASLACRAAVKGGGK